LREELKGDEQVINGRDKRGWREYVEKEGRKMR